MLKAFLARTWRVQQMVLTMEDLSTALEEQGVDVVKPEYFADTAGSASSAAAASALGDFGVLDSS